MTLTILSAPLSRRHAFSRFEPELVNHRQGGDAGPTSLGTLSAESDGGESGFDGVSSAQVRPVFSREVVEGEEHPLVFFQAIAGLWVFELVVRQEPIVGGQGILTRRGQIQVVKHLFSPALQTLGQLIEHVGGLMYPAALLLDSGTEFLLQGDPETERPVTGGQLGRFSSGREL
jgi:hypothetical protein